MTTAATGLDALIAFLLDRNPELEHIDDDLDLIESRVLDSLAFVNFVYLLEEQTGREINIQESAAEDFRTLARIRERFFA
jgi:acyl carrier protein